MVNRRQKHLFTLLELLVVCSIVLIFVTLLLGAIGHSKDSSRRLACKNNIRNLAIGILSFSTDKGHYPYDFLTADLSEYGSTPAMFTCPTTEEPYGLYYIPREIGCSDKYFIGCPHHEVVSFGAGRGISDYHFAPIMHDGTEITAGSVVTDGVLTFDDSSTVALNGTAMIVTSYRTEIQRLHTIVRVFDDYGTATLTVDVAAHSKFEVVTPAATVEAKGAEFKVRTMVPGGQMVKSKITVMDGSVQVTTTEDGAVTLTSPSPPMQVMVKLVNAHRIPPGHLP